MPFSNVLRLSQRAKEIADIIKSESGKISLVSHYDADGICAASLMYHALERSNKDFEVIFVKQLDKDAIINLTDKDSDMFIFTDLGSGQLSNIKEYLGEKKVVVVDHHQPVNEDWKGLYHLNPYMFGIDGTNEISGAGMSYILATTLDKSTRQFIDLAVVGAFADMQVNGNSLTGVNKMIYEDAEILGLVKKEKGLMLFGRYTKPIHKALEQCMDPFIKGISGNESGAVRLLYELGIPLRDKNNKFRTLSQLSRKEEKRLATALVMELIANGGDAEKAKSLIGDVYKIRESYEIREFATLLNACGRIGKPLEGLKFCLGLRESADDIYQEYRKAISNAISWVSRNLNNEKHCIKTEKATYILAGNHIMDTIIGTVLSMMIKNRIQTSVGFSFADSEGNTVKVSARSRAQEKEINLGLIIREAASNVGGEGGGHKTAAGASIPKGTEMDFINIAEELL